MTCECLVRIMLNVTVVTLNENLVSNTNLNILQNLSNTYVFGWLPQNPFILIIFFNFLTVKKQESREVFAWYFIVCFIDLTESFSFK